MIDVTKVHIRLTDPAGREILVRADTITLAVPIDPTPQAPAKEGETPREPGPSLTGIELANGATSQVRETVSDIRMRIDRARAELKMLAEG